MILKEQTFDLSVGNYLLHSPSVDEKACLALFFASARVSHIDPKKYKLITSYSNHRDETGFYLMTDCHHIMEVYVYPGERALIKNMYKGTLP